MPFRALLVIAVLATLAVAPAPAAAAKTPRVLTQVVGQSELVAGWRITTPGAFSRRIGGRTCRIPAATPLAALEQIRRQTGPDYTPTGSCAKPTVRSIGVDERFTVTIRGYDDKGRGIPVKDATVALNGQEVRTDPSGRATLTAPFPKGVYPMFATAPGMADAFPASVTST